MILQQFHLVDERFGRRTQDFREVFERVAQPLAGDAQPMVAGERRIGCAHPWIVGADGGDALGDEDGGDVSDALGQGLALEVERRRGRRPGRFQVGGEAFAETAIGVAIEIREHLRARLLASAFPNPVQRAEIGARLPLQRLQEMLGFLPEDIEIAYRAEGIARAAQALDEGAQRLVVQMRGEDLRRRAHPPARHAHIVQGFDVVAQPGARFVVQHPLEVEEEGLARRLGDGVIEIDARRGGQRDGFRRAARLRRLEQVREQFGGA